MSKITLKFLFLKKRYLVLLVASFVAFGVAMYALYFSKKNQKLERQRMRANIFLNCEQAMRNSVCSVMKVTKPSRTEGPVFIVGVGEVDKNSFEELQVSGDNMCGVVQEQCANNWDGHKCIIARALFR